MTANSKHSFPRLFLKANKGLRSHTHVRSRYSAVWAAGQLLWWPASPLEGIKELKSFITEGSYTFIKATHLEFTQSLKCIIMSKYSMWDQEATLMLFIHNNNNCSKMRTNRRLSWFAASEFLRYQKCLSFGRSAHLHVNWSPATLRSSKCTLFSNLHTEGGLVVFNCLRVSVSASRVRGRGEAGLTANVFVCLQ